MKSHIFIFWNQKLLLDNSNNSLFSTYVNTCILFVGKKEEGRREWWEVVSIGFPFGGLGEPNIYHNLGDFTRNGDFTWREFVWVINNYISQEMIMWSDGGCPMFLGYKGRGILNLITF